MTRHRSLRGALLPLLVFAAVGLFGLAPARAESPQETALARSLFEEGVALADQSDWSGAADRFGRAYALKPTAGIAFNFASVLIELGRFVEASELLRRVTRDTNASEALRRESEAKLAKVQPRIAYLILRVDSASPGDAHVDLDDKEWPKVAWGVASPVDPGTYTVRCVVGGVERARQQIVLVEGERREVTLTLSAIEPSSPPGPRVDASKPPPPVHTDKGEQVRRPFYKNWLFWTGIAVAVGGGVTAGVLLKQRSSDEPEPLQGNTDPSVIKW